MAFNPIPMDDRQITQLSDLTLKNLIKNVDLMKDFFALGASNAQWIQLQVLAIDDLAQSFDFSTSVGLEFSDIDSAVNLAFGVPLPIQKGNLMLRFLDLEIPITDTDQTGVDDLAGAQLFSVIGTTSNSEVNINSGFGGAIQVEVADFSTAIPLPTWDSMFVSLGFVISGAVADLNLFPPRLQYYYEAI